MSGSTFSMGMESSALRPHVSNTSRYSSGIMTMVGPTSNVNPSSRIWFILPPTSGSFSKSVTSYPACCKRAAAAKPATPAPITITRFMQLLRWNPIRCPVIVWLAYRPSEAEKSS